MTKNKELYGRKEFKSFEEQKTHEILSNMLVHLRELNRLHDDLRQTAADRRAPNVEYLDIDFVKLKNKVQLQLNLIEKK